MRYATKHDVHFLYAGAAFLILCHAAAIDWYALYARAFLRPWGF